jgi:hypothetical protein
MQVNEQGIADQGDGGEGKGVNDGQDAEWARIGRPGVRANERAFSLATAPILH